MLKTWCICFICLMTTAVLFSAEEIDLAIYEKSFFSQNGEDGVLAKIFELIVPKSKFCVEFGAYDGVTGSNTFLLRKQNWDCLLLDRLYEIPAFNLYEEFVTACNVNALFEKYHVPYDLDLLSIDVDFNDFYIWHALDKKYAPAVVVIEYNATHLPQEDKVVKYHPVFCGDDTNYYGASILALYQLGRSKGYSLIYAEQMGVNLFFVRDDLLKNRNWHFKNTNDVEKLYRYPRYGNGPNGGHRQDPLGRLFVSSQEAMERVQ